MYPPVPPVKNFPVTMKLRDQYNRYISRRPTSLLDSQTRAAATHSNVLLTSVPKSIHPKSFSGEQPLSPTVSPSRPEKPQNLLNWMHALMQYSIVVLNL